MDYEYEDDKLIRGNAAAVHLANCLANEVFMRPDALERAIVAVVRNRNDVHRFIKQTKDRIDVFTVILNSRYGTDYRETVKKHLFAHYGPDEWDGFEEFYFAWEEILFTDPKPDRNEISRLLHSEERTERIEGAGKLSIWTLKRGYDDLKTRTEQFWTDISSVILNLLQEDDLLSQYQAAYCIWRMGYNRKNVIPLSLVSAFANQLIALWLDKSISYNLHKAVSIALLGFSMPGLQIPDSPALREAVEYYLTDQDVLDKLVAVCLGILNHQLSGQEVRNYLKEVKGFLIFSDRFLRELGYIGEYINIIDENGNRIEDD